MKPVTRDELWTLERYEGAREKIRAEVMSLKNARRLAVGEHITLLFENERTVWYQVQEMLRAERIFSEDGIRHELETYNELIPGPNELSATMLIEYLDVEERDAALRALRGLERCIALMVGETRFPFQFDERQIDPDRLSAVQFVRIPMPGMTATQWNAAAKAGRVAVEVSHPKMEVRAVISSPLAAALAEDLVTARAHAG